MDPEGSEGAIVEILAAVCLYGFLNRWNDSMATDLEEPRPPRPATSSTTGGSPASTAAERPAAAGTR